MNEQEFDSLLTEALERNHQLDDLRRQIMHQINRSERQQRRRRLLRAAAFAFGLPAVTGFYALGIRAFTGMAGDTPLMLAVVGLSGAAMLWQVSRALTRFQIDQV